MGNSYIRLALIHTWVSHVPVDNKIIVTMFKMMQVYMAKSTLCSSLIDPLGQAMYGDSQTDLIFLCLVVLIFVIFGSEKILGIFAIKIYYSWCELKHRFTQCTTRVLFMSVCLDIQKNSGIALLRDSSVNSSLIGGCAFPLSFNCW